MKYLVIDAELNSTGIRDKYKGEYLTPQNLGIDHITITKLNEWLQRYFEEHYKGFTNDTVIENLDCEGKEIANMVKKNLPGAKIEYYSDAKMKSEII